MDSLKISEALTLPCGLRLKNRIAKAAMSENLASPDYRVNQKLITLYERWAKGGAGLLISGNIMIDPSALGEPKNLVFESGMNRDGLKQWTQAGTQYGCQFWAQLNHPGKQSPKFLSPKPLAPSAISLKAPLNRLFNEPRAMTEEEIQNTISRFADAASIAKEVGFTGVQIHGAHGYLVSQFLSPLHNQRQDQWGGSRDNRMRFVKEVYRAIRREVGAQFAVGIKLNSADFQRGGFSFEDSIEVAASLSSEGMDLIEISGGTYEAPEMTGLHHRPQTQSREAYFLDFCEKIKHRVSTPVMLTGGFRSLRGMESALETSACDVVGLARALALDPDFPKHLLASPGRGENSAVSQVKPLTTGFKSLDRSFPLEIIWYADQLHRMGAGKSPKANLGVFRSMVLSVWRMGLQGVKRVRTKA